MEYIVDVLGFKKPGDELVLKELAILCLSDDSEPLVWLFKEPFPWKRLTDKYRKENQWLENNSHCIPWSSGNVDYTLIDGIIRGALKDATRIIVRNQVIRQWIQQHWSFQQVVSLEEWGYPAHNLRRPVTTCPNHNGKNIATCALYNVKQIEVLHSHEILMDWEY